VTRARYPEYDTLENVLLHANTAALVADSGKIGTDIVYLTNSAACLRALVTAATSNSTNIKAIVAYECVGGVVPEDAVDDAPDMGASSFGAYFGPHVLSVEDFKKIARLPAVQFVWGDHRGVDGLSNPLTAWLEMSKYMVEVINGYGGNAEILMLGDDAGLKGSSHIAFADMDNDKVGELLEGLLHQKGLDGYA